MLTFSVRSTPARAAHRLIVASSLISAVALVSLVACKSLTSVDASFDNVTDSLDFYPLNSAPPGTPTAMALFDGQRQPANESFSFDIAFDLSASGQVVLIPVRALATGLSSPYSVGLQRVPNIGFDALDEAPKTGYVVDSTLAVTLGSVVVIESHDTNRCAFAIKGQSYFSKLEITAIDTATRKISTLIEVNRNCGFRSFAAGKPKD